MVSNQALHDWVVAKQLYLERFKLTLVNRADSKLQVYLKRMIALAMHEVGDDIGSVSKSVIRRVLRDIKRMEGDLSPAVIEYILHDLRLMVGAEVTILLGGKKDEDEAEKIYRALLTDFVSSYEGDVRSIYTGLVESVGKSVRQQVVNGYSQSLTKDELAVAMATLSPKLRSGVSSAITTGSQAASVFTLDRLLLSRYPKYIWVSTIDSRTSTICRSRHLVVYEVGSGPLPPAHPHCRSTTSPWIDGGGPVKDEKFGVWLSRFDPDKRSDLLSSEPLDLKTYIQKVLEHGIEEEN